MKIETAVAFLLVKDNRFLAEKRRRDKETFPGMWAVPGGRMELGESMEETLHREMNEELNLKPLKFEYYCTLVERQVGYRLTIHFHVVTQWEGNQKVLEAQSVEWIPIEDHERIEVPIDRAAVREYIRTFMN